MSEETSSVILDGTNPTLDGFELSYKFEKARVYRETSHVLR